MKIYFVTADRTIDDIYKNELESIGEFIHLPLQKASEDEFIAKCQDADILIVGSSGVDRLSEKIFSSLKNLKFVSLLTVGHAWVDVNAAQKHGIPVSNVKGSNSESVAEHTWGMILDLSKRITEFYFDARTKGAYKFMDYQGKEVFGKTLGVIGLGDIGKKVARIANGFNMRVLGVNKSGKLVKGVELVSLPVLFKQSHVIAVCVPITSETENLISDKEFGMMKDGAILVNCAREKIVNKQAVLKALKSGELFGYGVETEIMKPIPLDDPYFDHPRIVLNPHNAFNTEDAERKGDEMVIDNVNSFLAGKPQNLIV